MARLFKKWTKPLILRELKRLHKSEADLSYTALARRKQPLLSAAAYHFGSYRTAIERAGIEYTGVLRRPRWTRQTIIKLIKQAKRRGDDLHWSAVTKRNDELSRAAFASLQPRLFGKWVRALHAAGLDADDVSMYRTWDRNTVLFQLRQRHSDGDTLNSGDVQREEPALHAAAVRHFHVYDRALRAARINPAEVRRRRTWDRSSVVKALRSLERREGSLTDGIVRRNDAALHGASIRLFGSFTRARSAAGID
ncbi:MAG: hypothetical protein H7Z14_06685 [Anaerolineae bacterium]|nr:hypothetical protein [Phycisphaerae bacterium]